MTIPTHTNTTGTLITNQVLASSGSFPVIASGIQSLEYNDEAIWRVKFEPEELMGD